MNRLSEEKNRRNDPPAKGCGMVIVLAHPRLPSPGCITNISAKGLTFQYSPNGSGPITSGELDIIWADFAIAQHLKKLPVQMVSDLLLDDAESTDRVVKRRQTVLFKNLSWEQKVQIDRLIQTLGTT